MSSFYTEFFCTECDFKTTDLIKFGGRFYAIGGESIVIENTLGWCLSCKTFSPIEVLPSQGQIDRLKQHIAFLAECCPPTRKPPRKKRSWLAVKLLGEEAPPLPMMDDSEGYDLSSGPRYDLKLLERRALLLAGRSSPPRCLTCSSIKVITPELLYPSGGNPQTTGFEHPACGGVIMANTSDTRVWNRFSRRIFDREGVFIRAEDKDGNPIDGEADE